jgi:hypothetical protein
MNLESKGLIIIAYTLCFLTALSGLSSAIASSLVLIIDHHQRQIIIASDGLMRSDNPLTSRVKKSFECKIVTQSNCTYGMVGAITQPDTHFDLQTLATAACKSSGDLRRKADNFAVLAAAPAKRMADYIRVANPDYYSRVSVGKEFLISSVFFAGLQDEKLWVFGRELRMEEDGSIRVASGNVQFDASGPQVVAAGMNKEIVAYLDSHHDWDQEMSPIAAAIKFVQIEIQAHPEQVGPPISVLTINS